MSAETKRIREAVFKRAENLCEADCLQAATSMDHFFGRAKAKQAVANCWCLCVRCDYMKTNSQPSAAAWLLKFADHCEWWGYEAEAARARDRLAFVEARTALVSR